MSEVQRRTIFVDNRKGYLRFYDWARVVTELGTMFEPYLPQQKPLGGEVVNRDDGESTVQIDAIEGVDFREDGFALTGGERLHGGFLTLRGI